MAEQPFQPEPSCRDERHEEQPRRPYRIPAGARSVGILAALGLAATTTGALVVNSRQPHASATDRAQLSSKQQIANGNFTAGISGWRVNSPGIVTAVGNGYRDKSALRLTTRTTSTLAVNDMTNTVASTTAGSKFKVSAWVHTTTPNVNTQLRVREVKDGQLVNEGESHISLRDTSWRQLSFTYSPMTTGASIDVNIVVWRLGPQQSLDIDTVSLRFLPAPTSEPSGDGTAPPDAFAAPPDKSLPEADPAQPSISGTAPVTLDIAPPGMPASSPVPTIDRTACTLSDKLVPSCGALWGIYTKPNGSEGWETPFTSLENSTGRQFDIVKRYHDWSNEGSNGQFPDAAEKALGANGQRTLLFAWTSNIWSDGTFAKWADITAGKYDDTVIRPAAERIKAWNLPVFMSFDHEMDGAMRTKVGTSAEFVAAFRHIHDVMTGSGVSNIIWVWNPTGYLGNASKIAEMYPGDQYVDWIAWDPYNFYHCNNSAWKSPEVTIGSFYDWLVARGMDNKPFMLGEYGSSMDPNNSSAMGDWYSGMNRALKQYPKIKAAVMWNSALSGRPYCDFRLSTSAHTLQGYASAGRDPYLNIDLTDLRVGNR